ncbi:response regulator [[Clostridium] symbiosum]|nr:response regulator [[Clostridium] symbiosum]MCB6929607.1 response regulator [[Clostridium] symbiosum]
MPILSSAYGRATRKISRNTLRKHKKNTHLSLTRYIRTASEQPCAVNRQDLVFISCDISMPVMDGFTFLREKNKSVYNNGIPVIIITSVGDDRVRQQAISLGAADFVDKKKRPRESLRSGQRTARDTGMNRATTQIRS